jgi:hypothetical protein
MWLCVDAHPATCLDLRLICSGTRSVGYRQIGPSVRNCNKLFFNKGSIEFFSKRLDSC